MESMIAYCGIHCDQCPTYLATVKDDDQARAQVADQWSKQFMMDLKLADINCDGCLTTGGRLFQHCANCNIRKCSMDKGLENCAHCDEYACEQLTQLFQMIPYAKDGLEAIRRKL